MDGAKIVSLCVGSLATNCYVIYNPKTKNSILVEPGDDPHEIDSFLKRHELLLRYVVLTHGHIDHIKGLTFFSEPFYIHGKDRDFLTNPQLNASSFISESFTTEREPLLVADNDVLQLDEVELRILHTPGHTPGSVSLCFGNKVLTGDLLFFDSVGRTDMPYGSSTALANSIKEKILPLADDTEVYPGHGPMTTVGRERKHNPFLIY